jgi:prepilin-type N-terminal cleavage/methylation domain-containing protein
MKKNALKNIANKNQQGFTLVEALIALIIFVSVVVPLLVYLNGGKSSDKAADIMIAESFLELETTKVKTMSDEPPREVVRTINGREWKCVWGITGQEVQLCKATIFKQGAYIADAAFYRSVTGLESRSEK